MPTNTNIDKKETQKMYDKDVARFAKRIAVAYSSDKIRLVTSRNVRRAVLLHDIDAINDVIKDIPNMPDGFRSDFCDAFIGEDMSGLELATPAILGYAYRAISARVQNGDKSQQDRLDKLAARIDDLSTDFANSGGMIVRQHEWPLINMSNIANENEDFAIMLDARMADVDDEKKDEIRANSDYAKKIAQDYDKAWNLDKLRPEDADKLADRCDEIYDVLYSVKIRNSVMQKFAKVKLLDSKDRVIRQFTSGKRGDREKYENYQPGFDILEGSRFESIVELVEHDIAKRYIADVNAKIDKDVIEDEFNETLLTKLYEIYAADQVSHGATETPEQFADQEFLKSFEKMLEPDGDGVVISDNGYNVAIETQTDATIGWVARIRNKVGGDGKKLEKLWKKINRSLEYVDDMADVRMSRAAVERRKKRRNFAGRVLVGFSSSFIASALITVIATATAAKMGLTLASGLALVGGGAALGIMGFQIARWIRNQKKNNLPVSWEEFKKDKQLLRSLGTSGLAIAAMVLGVFGLADAAMGVGIGAATLGAYSNGRRMFQSAQDSGMSQRQKIAWTIASVASVIVGALGGRLGAQWGIGKYNEWNPDNAWFNNKTAVAGEPEKISDEITHERIIRHYSDNMLESAKDAVEGWYAHDYPNHPEILQQDIDAINQYNIDHDTNLDPYRILRAMKISQPSRLAYTPGWSNTYNVPQELISQAAHAVGGGVYDPAGMEAAKFLDANYLGESGNVGDVPIGHTINKTYSPITELPTETTETIVDQPAVYKTVNDVRTEPVEVRAGYGAFGNYTPRERIKNLRDRVGSFLDRVRGNRRNEPVTEEVPPVIDNEEEKIPTFTLDEPQEQQLPTVILDERDEELRTTGENTPSPARRKEYVAPVVNLSQPQQVPDLRLKDMPVALPDPESRKYEPYSDFALTEAQAERWNDLHKQLATIRAKSRSSRGDKILKLRKQANRLTDEINSFTAELGNPTTFMLEQALAEIERRKKLKDSIGQYKRHMAKKPSGDSVSDWRSLKWEEELSKLVDKIEALGGWDSLDESKLRFATPKPGRLEQKRAEIAQRDTDRQQPQRVFEMPMREQQPEERLPLESEQQERDTDILAKRFEFNHQKPDFENRYPRDKRLDLRNHTMAQPVLKSAMRQYLVSYPLMEIRGVPVNLVDLDGHTNPITNNDGRAMVVVDIDGLRIPFYLANGNEPSGLEIPGKWYPMFSMVRDGKWFFGQVGEYINDKSEGMAVIKGIAAILNARIGDIRNHIYKIPHVSTSRIYNLVGHAPNNLTKYMIWAPSPNDNALNAHVPWLKWYFNNIQAPNYDERAAKRQLRQAKREGRKEWLQEKFGLGSGGLYNRVRERFSRWNDDSNEYE